MVKIIHNDYEKITDKIMYLSAEYILKFTVELNRKTKHGKENYHKEFGYSVDNEYRVNILRDINSYLSIESLTRADANKIQVRIGIKDIYFFKSKLQQVVQWFINDQYKNLFVKKDDRIIIPTKVDSIIAHVSFGQYIEFEPTTIFFNNEQLIGVRVYLSSDSISFFMDVNTLLSLNYFIETFNMYQSAQILLNYLGRPENGTNYTDFNSSNKAISRQTSGGFFDRTNSQKI